MAPDDWWFEERILLSERLGRALQVGGIGGRVQVVMALDALAEQLNLNTDRLRDASYHVLHSLLAAIEKSIEAEGRGSWSSDAETHRHERIADSAVTDVDLATAVDAMSEFGWGSQQIRGDPAVVNLETAVRDLLAKKLAQPIYKMMDNWRKKRAWTDHVERNGRQWANRGDLAL